MSMKCKREKKTRIAFTYLMLILLVLGLTGTAALASDDNKFILRVNKKVTEYNLINQLQILQDTEKKLTLNDILNTGISKEFIPYKDSNLSGEISNSAYWVRVVIQNDEDNILNMFLEISKPHLSSVHFYRFDNGNLVQEVQTGMDYSFDKREVNNRNFVFGLPLPPKSSQTIILRVEAKSYLQLPVKLYSVQAFLEKEERSVLILGIYYGIMLVMFMYNLLLYFSLKDNTYLYYCCYLLGFSMLQLTWDGLAFQYIWPKFVFWNSKANPFFIILTSIFALRFTAYFLRIGDKSKIFNKIISYILIFQITALIPVILISTAVATKIAVPFVIINLIFCFSCIKLVGIKDRAAYLYILSWIALFLGSVLNIMAAYKMLPLNFITLFSPRMGSVINAVLLSFSLGDRFSKMKQDKIIEVKQRILLETLHGITKTITSTNDINAMVSFLLKKMSEITKYENGMIILKEKQQYIVRAVLGCKADELKDKNLFKDKQDIYFRKMIEENKVAMLADIKMSQYGIDKSFKSLIGFPIIYYGENVGIIILYSDTIQTFNQIQNEILFDFAGQVGIVIENARLFNQVEKMAAIDGLTGSFNRPHFLKLSEALIKDHRNKGTTLSLIMIDIDYFKKINDTYGHLVGDMVLRQLVSELKIELGEASIIGRYGGEEFLILLKETNLEDALTIAERLRLKIESLRLDIDKDNLIGFTISIGVSVTNDDINDNIKLIEKADQALYISKLNGRNQVNTVINLP